MPSDRRTLTEGLRNTPTVDPAVEKSFVFGTAHEGPTQAGPQPKVAALPRPAAVVAEPAMPPTPVGNSVSVRVPLTSRIRPEVAAALKRMSLERRLAGREPNTVQDIVEEALDSWLALQSDAPAGVRSQSPRDH